MYSYLSTYLVGRYVPTRSKLYVGVPGTQSSRNMRDVNPRQCCWSRMKGSIINHQSAEALQTPPIEKTEKKARQTINMKLSITISTIALCAAAATAFTVGPQNGALSQQSPRLTHMALQASEALEIQTNFAKSEIESNDVSRINQEIEIFTPS